MKKLFLSLVFVFAIAFSFADNNSSETKFETPVFYNCIEVTLSCGVFGYLCGDTSDEALIAMDDIVCGPFPE